MFQIGETLRQARLARNLELEAIAGQTKIPARYLAALERERFDLLPGDAYARGFLREYAQILELDPGPFLDELDCRPDESEPSPLMLLPPPRRSFVPLRRIVVLVATGAVVAFALLAWRFGGERQQPMRTAAPGSPLSRPLDRPESSSTTEHVVGAPALLLAAARGDCWLSVRVGSRSGQVLYEGLLRQGASLRFRRQPLWIRIGAPWNLDVRLNGQPMRVLTKTGNVLLARSELQRV